MFDAPSLSISSSGTTQFKFPSGAEKYPSALTRSKAMMRRILLCLDLVDLAMSVIDKIVIVLHDSFHFLHRLGIHSRTLHRFFECLHIRHFHFGNERPIALAREVGHEAHLTHAALGEL